ncbi:bifunctional UDP-N-acetylglucosamine diphosphorylase/glucosamine-1-phosphate N-acetyltransferase GlmU [Hippea maritima]|uniref:Bifunctional protein GlmU n=1 Tax=Hippea maritima (strain ATCC 700847 / DSM 10411 / MH2) TaxID=760142 RepID=F2LW91_HIPMA|nr:bifunctional UDP-N-acetylglucosamine diphosphorylase/glucosamine-1-phosphate N-acetyltransferase GlmU [Hippea maritima]AEA34025.1 Bifunctional protein glmU [Hippea maritima DSM 10411]
MEAVILAAGKSTRMKSKTSKIFHSICGKPMIFYVVEALKRYKIHIVANTETYQTLQHLFPQAQIHIQKNQKGTADALNSVIDYIKDENFVVVNGDMPLINTDDIESAKGILEGQKFECVLLTAELENPTGYGRIVRDNYCIEIIEEKNASDEVKKIKEVNSGIYIFNTKAAKLALPKIQMDTISGEYYLTDILKHLKKVEAVRVDSENILGVNTRKQLSQARKILQKRIIERFDNVTFVDDENTYVNYDVTIGDDTVIFPNVHLKGNTTVGRNCIIENGSIIENSVIKDNVHIKPYSVIEESLIKSNCEIGPFAHLRPLSELGENVRIGNFVETKKVKIGKNTKASHLTYLGDATLGEDVNVGCGTITCNYDGYRKNETIIGDRVFIGSDVQLVAPVEIGNDALIAAGTTVTKNVEEFALAISRVPQTNKPGWVKKFRETMEKKLKEEKNAK